MMELPEDLQEAFRNELYQFEEEQQMPYVTSIERMALKKGRRKGVRKAVRRVGEGREEGREEGRVEALRQRFCVRAGSGSARPRRSSRRRSWRR